ncbi:MAG: carbamoyltransferase HypF [bacterium]
MNLRREKLVINGIVQGVGFRPFVYRLAREYRLGGFVNNRSDGVLIEVEGSAQRLQDFRQRLRSEAPPMAKIVELCTAEIDPLGENEFVIQASDGKTQPTTLISPDIGICEDCLRELFDPHDRRYRYPFINCTNCGPRFTIVERIPYDRPFTSMKVFPMCPACSEEYHNPGNRRFHAQPNACPQCGPKLSLHDQDGREVAADDVIESAVNLLRAGKILAVRGVGGFHLAVDARNESAVQELRRRKGRAEKPFAMMAADLDSIGKYGQISELEAQALQQPTRPIVLLQAHAEHSLAPAVAPGNRYLGFMLPYTPLHYLLLREPFDALVMTSGNFSEEPIAIGNQEALDRLAPLADYFLLHDREIRQRADDSIVRCVAGEMRAIRRARGYVPAPVFLAHPTRKRILACGGELKNTFALCRDEAVFLSQHIGDLDNPSALDFFEYSIEYLQQILQITPEVIAYDLHPEYLSTKWALKQTDCPKIGVQHHHAHLVAVMAENGVETPTIGIILDGTGYGTDGTIWGGEVLIGDARRFERYAWLEPVALPGGAAAIRQPWRMALSYLFQAFGRELFQLELTFVQRVRRQQAEVIVQMIEKQVNAPLTSSCGRLFDAVSALLNIRHEINFEAQAAIELEMALDPGCLDTYEDRLLARPSKGALPVDRLIKAVVADIQKGTAVGKISARFHRTLGEIFLKSAQLARTEAGINRVGLSGGVFQNPYLFEYLIQRLKAHDFEVLTHKQVPANDGGLALGQLVIADAASH